MNTTAQAIVRNLEAVIDALDQADTAAWHRPTRCEPWDVTDLTAHIAIPAAALANGLEALRNDQPRSKGGEPLDPTPAPDTVLAELRTRLDRLRLALEAVTDDEFAAALPPPTDDDLPLPTSTVLQLALVEIGVHRSDLDHALGRDDALDDDVISAVNEVVPMWLLFGAAGAPRPPHAVTYRVAGERIDVVFAYREETGWSFTPDDEARTHAVEGDDSDLALYLLGRKPHPDDNDLKRYLPGP